MSDYAPTQQPVSSTSSGTATPAAAAEQSNSTAAASGGSSTANTASPSSGGGGALGPLDLVVLSLLAGWLTWRRDRGNHCFSGVANTGRKTDHITA
jgi:hypothetical protein